MLADQRQQGAAGAAQHGPVAGGAARMQQRGHRAANEVRAPDELPGSISCPLRWEEGGAGGGGRPVGKLCAGAENVSGAREQCAAHPGEGAAAAAEGA